MNAEIRDTDYRYEALEALKSAREALILGRNRDSQRWQSVAITEIEKIEAWLEVMPGRYAE